ncbi:MAG TPA: type I-B CRISPR-associated protein Cas5 [Calditrichaeota bacterium]|nr:type I-B CRISPR-associated protein Cas5 [Calditrichota bacterium]
MKFLVFDIQADWAHFKKPFTTMSPQTFGIPTGTAIIGMISAIIGLDKKEYWKYFPLNSYLLSVRVLGEIKKTVVPINTLKTDSMKQFSRYKQHKRTNMEFLKDARFRIYFWWENRAAFQILKEQLIGHKTYYTLSLGLAWNLADFKYVGLFHAEESFKREWTTIHSVIRKDHAIEINFGLQKIFCSRIPVQMKAENDSRQVLRYDEYIYDAEGKSIKVKVKSFLKLENGENIIPF